jgi:hypothetical protein
MFAKDLVGKLAVRTKASSLGDNSYTTSPVLIVKAADAHIVIRFTKEDPIGRMFNVPHDRTHLLNYTFCDDAWTDFEELITESEDKGYAE